MSKIAIVVVTYNRPEALHRLLSSIGSSVYNSENIPLIISVDYQNSENHQEVVDIACSFEWKFGEKIVNIEKENLGLKNHVIKCGDLTEIYDAVIVLEDDIYVSKYFYKYAIQAHEYYEKDKRIAGISLYNHGINSSCHRPFMPIQDDADVYFLQYAQSWGQLLSKNQWKDFKKWFVKNQALEFKNLNIPSNIWIWSEKSWLKWHIKYVIDTNKFFVYPRVSLTTNFTEIGTHNSFSTQDFQVSLQYIKKNEYRFIGLNDSVAVYDAFFENLLLKDHFKNMDVEIDLYGQKKKYTSEFVLTCHQFENCTPEKMYGLKMRPHELNIINNIYGEDLFLYKTEDIPKEVFNKERVNMMLYDFKTITARKLIVLLIEKIKDKLKRMKSND